VTILAQRRFVDVEPFAFLQSLGFDYAIRFRRDIQVSAQTGETWPATDWVGAGGRGRGRLLLLSTLAVVLLMLLGAIGESLGRHRLLKFNARKR